MIRTCISCGCTDTNACMTANGPCHWVCHEPPICSAPACAAILEALEDDIEASAPDNDDPFVRHRLACLHEKKLFTDQVNWYCTECGTHARDEAA